tara:strand:- start:2066 stop:3058 length:993 start_codon:yes stop_codon:yes gene_type:complete
MKKDQIKEDQFYKGGDYKFSYTSMNKLMFSPQLFYKDYILKEREEKTDKHLIEGKLLHLLILEPERLNEDFSIVPTKVPSESLKKVLKLISNHSQEKELSDVDDNVILDCLHEVYLYQSLKDTDKRVAKVRTTECEDYYSFMCNSSGKDIIDNDMLLRAMDRVQIIKDNKQVMDLLFHQTTDFELDPIESYNEKYLECALKEYSFGLKGYVDRYIIDHETKQVTIVDIKTTSKSLDKFAETVDYYNYWMQAVIYITLVIKNSEKDISDYKINFNFVVIDNYDQVYVFDVSDNTLQEWYKGFTKILEEASYHYEQRDYSLPYEFANGNVIL